jgi:hypothetical protein
MTRFARLLSAALAATSVVALSSPANAVVPVRPTINIPQVRPVLPATHAPTLPATHAPTPSKVNFTPVKYPEITDALGRPIGYVSQGKPVYFPNGHMPAGFVVGPNHTIETYVSSTSTPPTPVNKPAPAPQQPSSSKPAAHQQVTFKPVSYPEITDGYGRPIGYTNGQGQAVYFNNGQMPAGFSVGPNHTIQTYIKS